MEALLPRVARCRYVLVPASGRTRGHGTHTWAALWKQELGETAVLSGRTLGRRGEEDRETPNRVRYLRVWTKRDGAWRAVLQMAVPMPPSP